MKKINKKVLSLILTCAFSISLLSTVFSAPAMARYPYISPEHYSNTVIQGEIFQSKFTILHAYKNEKVHIRIHWQDKDGAVVASADRSFAPFGNLMSEWTVSWDTSKEKTGKYVVEYWAEFYSFYSWHENPSRTYLMTIDVKPSPCKNGHKFNSGVVTKAPTCRENGVSTKTCTVCGVTETTILPKTAHQWDSGIVQVPATATTAGSRVFTCKVCKEVKYETISPKFKDIEANGYYLPAVNWAVNTGVTGGTSKDTFSPNNGCTRGQAVSFLWRAMGSPEPTTVENPFTDVTSQQYYYKPVLWAVEKGIVAGTSPNTFSPDETCSYAHILTFIWRSQGEPGSTATEPWYSDALSWATNNNLLEATNCSVSVNAACPRKDMVTYLYRISINQTTENQTTENV